MIIFLHLLSVIELLRYINDLDKSDEYRSFLLKLEKEIYENKHFTKKQSKLDDFLKK